MLHYLVLKILLLCGYLMTGVSPSIRNITVCPGAPLVLHCSIDATSHTWTIGKFDRKYFQGEDPVLKKSLAIQQVSSNDAVFESALLVFKVQNRAHNNLNVICQNGQQQESFRVKVLGTPHAPALSGMINGPDSISFIITPPFVLASLCIHHYNITPTDHLGKRLSDITVRNVNAMSVSPTKVTVDDFDLCVATYTFTVIALTHEVINMTRSEVLHLPSIHFTRTPIVFTTGKSVKISVEITKYPYCTDLSLVANVTDESKIVATQTAHYASIIFAFSQLSKKATEYNCSVSVVGEHGTVETITFEPCVPSTSPILTVAIIVLVIVLVVLVTGIIATIVIIKYKIASKSELDSSTSSSNSSSYKTGRHEHDYFESSSSNSSNQTFHFLY